MKRFTINILVSLFLVFSLQGQDLQPKSWPGIRPHSFFGSNTSELKTGRTLDKLSEIGMRIQRGHTYPDLLHIPEIYSSPLPVDFTSIDERLAMAKGLGTWTLPILGYAFEGTRSEMAIKYKQHGPPRDFQEWVNTWELFVKRYPEIMTYEIWNEPWIYEWTWADTPSEFRKLQIMTAKMLQKNRPGVRILAGNSVMFFLDNLEPYPESWRGLVDGLTHHPYCSATGEPNYHCLDQQRSIDFGMVESRRLGIDYYYLTEGGTHYGRDGKSNLIENAIKVVQYNTMAALSGTFQSNVQWGIGIGFDYELSNEAYKVMSYLLEDRPIMADVFPSSELLYGALFAHPRNGTDAIRKLARGEELTARWDVEVPSDRDGDSTVVAVLFNLTGQNKFLLDDHGTLSIDHPADIKAYDIFGKEIVPGGEGFSIPFSNSPVYLLSNQLSVLDFYGKLQHARIEQITPVKMYALSLEEDVDQPQKLRVRIENMLAEPVEGTLFHEVEGKDEAGSTEFRLEAGELGEVSLDWKGTLEWNEDNVYPIKLSAKTRTSRSELYEVSEKFQFLNVAQMPERSIRVDGNIAEWREIEPLCANSALMLNEVDPTCCLLHPGAECCNSQESDKVKIKTRIAYDDNYIYVSAEILEKESSNLAGTKEFEDLEYIKGMSGGLRHPTTTGDCLQLAFGFRNRVPGRGRQMDDNWAWKGFYYDTDYQYLVYPSSEGDQLVQQWDESSPRRNGFQTEKVEEIHPLQGSRVQISRDEENETTIYELAIPRNEIPLFNEELEDFRFSYIYNNNEGASGGRLQYSNMMGVFDHWRNFGSFAPTWMQTTSCQTFVHIK